MIHGRAGESAVCGRRTHNPSRARSAHPARTVRARRRSRRYGIDLLVTHHPLLLRGIHSVATTGAKGETLTRAILGDLAIYNDHVAVCIGGGYVLSHGSPGIKKRPLHYRNDLISVRRYI